MKPWSFSTLEKFETCPRQFHEIKVKKSVVEVETEEQLWGKDVHTALDNCIRSGTPLPDKMKQWQSLVDKIKAMPAVQIFTESPVSLDENFRPAPWDNCWTRGVIDVLVLGKTSAIVLDWKTGRRKPTMQLLLYAAYVFAMYPQIDTVHTALVWLQSKHIDKATIKRKEAATIWQVFVERAARLKSAFERDSWPERPSGLCKNWCAVTQCKYNGKKDIPIWSTPSTAA